MNARKYAEIRERATEMVTPTLSDAQREQMISAKAAEALSLCVRDHEKAREVMAEHALLVRGRSKAQVEQMERERGLA